MANAVYSAAYPGGRHQAAVRSFRLVRAFTPIGLAELQDRHEGGDGGGDHDQKSRTVNRSRSGERAMSPPAGSKPPTMPQVTLSPRAIAVQRISAGTASTINAGCAADEGADRQDEAELAQQDDCRRRLVHQPKNGKRPTNPSGRRAASIIGRRP